MILQNHFAKLAALINQGKEPVKLIFELSKKDLFNYHDDRNVGEFGEEFIALDKIIKPCIYWFEMEHAVSASYFEKQINQINDRKIPPINTNVTSKTIYLGKRFGGATKVHNNLSNIAGRIAVHLGYHHNGAYQGLQLTHWCKEKIIINISEFPEEAVPYLEIIEKLYAMELSPIFGKH